MKHITGLKKELILMGNLRSRQLRKLPLAVLAYLQGTFKNEKLTKFGDKYIVNTFMPPFPSPAFEQFIKNTVAAYNHNLFPYSTYVGITNKCGFNCWHCSKAYRKGNDLSMKDWAGIMGKLQELGVSMIGYTGGEPLYRNDLEEIVTAVGPTATTILFTTGDGFTLERAKKLKESGLFYVAISLDHYEKNKHNELRGSERAFDVALTAIKNSLDAGFYTAVQLAARKDFLNKNDMDKYVEFARALGVQEIRIIEPMPTGALINKEQDVFLSEAEREFIKSYHIEINKDKNLPKIASFAYLEDKNLYGCGAGTQHLYIDNAGNLCPCDFTPLSFGNVVTDGFNTVYSRIRNYFDTPQNKCFVLNNMDKIKSGFTSELPIKYEKSMEICKACVKEGLPEFYRKLGW
ncbi:MAG: radical SAM protein [Candidatus Omnitrophota bacterium]|jgi:MoaA/NifB/PqqE/SkfB family radical SAM enzyme